MTNESPAWVEAMGKAGQALQNVSTLLQQGFTITVDPGAERVAIGPHPATQPRVNWLPVALIGGGILLAVVLLAA